MGTFVRMYGVQLLWKTIWQVLKTSNRIVVQPLSRVQLCDPMTVATRLLSMGFYRQGYWGGLWFPPPEDLPDPGIEPMPPALAGGFFTTELQGKPKDRITISNSKY